MAKATFDIKTEAQKTLKAGVGAADLAVKTVRDYVTTAQETVKGLELRPTALRAQATTVVSTRAEELSRDAKARRDAVEKRVAELQAEAQRLATTSVDTATGTFESLVERGAKVVNRLRKQTSSVADPGPVKKSTGETTTAKKAPAAKVTVAKTTAKTPVKKTPVKKTTRKAPAKKVTAVRATAKKAPAKATTGK